MTLDEADKILAPLRDVTASLADAVVEGEHTRAKQIAHAYLAQRHHENEAAKQQWAEQEKREEEARKAHVAGNAAIATWTPVLGPMFRAAGRHLGGNAASLVKRTHQRPRE